jgi:hypothetical protein
MSEGESLRRQSAINELRTAYLQGRLSEADHDDGHECSVEDCSRPAVKTVWTDDEDSENVNLCSEHYEEVTRD